MSSCVVCVVPVSWAHGGDDPSIGMDFIVISKAWNSQRWKYNLRKLSKAQRRRHVAIAIVVVVIFVSLLMIFLLLLFAIFLGRPVVGEIHLHDVNSKLERGGNGDGVFWGEEYNENGDGVYMRKLKGESEKVVLLWMMGKVGLVVLSRCFGIFFFGGGLFL